MNATATAPETLDARKARLAALRRERMGIDEPAPPFAETLPQVPDEPDPGSDVALHHAAVEAAISALKIETQARLAEIPVTLRRMIAKARRGNPDKRDQRIRDATRWADDAQTILLQSLADREAELLTGLRTLELAGLEARRGGSVRTEVRDIETPILKNGAPVWRRGRKSTKRERITRPIVSRDGLESLARSHLGADGEVRRYPDGSPYAPAIDRFQFAAGMKYREAFEAADPERCLKAVDLLLVASGRFEREPFGRVAIERASRRSDKGAWVVRLEALALHAAGPEGVTVLREIAGKGLTLYAVAGSGGPHKRMSDRLRAVLDALAEHFGLC